MIEEVLLTLPLAREQRQRLVRSLQPARIVEVSCRDTRGIAGALKRADVAILAGDLDRRFLAAPRLNWVHCGHAGLERSAFPEVFERGLIVTSAAGRSAPALAEHVMMFALNLAYRYPALYEAQRARSWGIGGQGTLRALSGRTMGLVGLGHTGRQVAHLARAFGMRVVAFRRSAEHPAGVDRLLSSRRGDRLDELLQVSDFVVLCLPLSDASHRMIGMRELALMRRDAYLINIARGGLIEEAALVHALEVGHIAGAAIDVAEEEPLAVGSRLWDAPNLLITPHFTPPIPERDERALETLLENIRRYRADEPLLNRLTREDQFTPPPAEGRALTRHASRYAQLLRRLRHRLRTR